MPMINYKKNLTQAVKVMNKKKLGIVVITKKRFIRGLITDGDLKRIAQKYKKFENLNLKKIMTKNPVSVDIETLAASALSIMNAKKITSLCVYKGKKKRKTVGIIHMHDILRSNIS